MKKCSDLQHYKWSLGIFLKLCFIHWKLHLKHVVLCVSAFLKHHIKVNVPSYSERIKVSSLSVLSSLSFSFITEAVESVGENRKSMSSFMYALDGYVATMLSLASSQLFLKNSFLSSYR